MMHGMMVMWHADVGPAVRMHPWARHITTRCGCGYG